MKRKPRHPGGFFILFGSRNRIGPDGHGSIQAPCPACHRMTRLDGMQVKNWFTLYFIPIFPTGSGTRFTQCAACKAQFRANIDEMRAMLGRAGAAQGQGQRPPNLPQAASFPAAIALYNSLKETPADSAKLARLLKMYLDMGEPREVISAGRTYPMALEGSDACLSLMSQAFLMLGDRQSAARHAAAALALNPSNKEAAALEGQAMAVG